MRRPHHTRSGVDVKFFGSGGLLEEVSSHVLGQMLNFGGGVHHEVSSHMF